MEERRVLIGNPISKGVAKAEAYHYESLMPDVERGYFKPGKETEYWKSFKEALARAREELQQLQEQVSASDEKVAAIFAAHIAILKDEDLLYEIKNAILNDRMYPELAIEACFEELIIAMREVNDAAIEERIIDIYDVKRCLLQEYFGKMERCLSHLDRDVIVVVHNLLPSEVATIDRMHVKGIVIEKDVTNSHAVVLAKSYEIPLVVGVANATTEIPDGVTLAMDASTGELILELTTEDVPENSEK